MDMKGEAVECSNFMYAENKVFDFIQVNSKQNVQFR